MSGLTDERAAFARTRRLLWGAAQSVAQQRGVEAWEAFEAVGLLLDPPGTATSPGYDATPAGAETFASTGGDGVHFSFVPTGDSSVIVMTVPMMFERPNVVVGRDLVEFLSLGCHYGYFRLEQLAYAPEVTAGAIGRAVDGDHEGPLAVLRKQLALSPWPDVGRRLVDLAASTPTLS